MLNLTFQPLLRNPRYPPPPAASSRAPRVSSSQSAGGIPRQLVEVTDGVLVLEDTGIGARVSTISAAGTTVERGQIPLASFPYRYGIERIPELGVVAVCVFDMGVSLILLDEEGTRVSGPTPIKVSAQNEPPFGYAESCDLAWSGSELLVVWYATGRVPPGAGEPLVELQPPLTRGVQARIVQLPELSSH